MAAFFVAGPHYRGNVPVNSKTAHPPPGNPRAFDSRQALYSGEFDPKWGPPCGAFDFRVKTSVSGRRQKDFAILWFSRRAAFTGHCFCRFHEGFSVVVVYIVLSWNMPLFKVWSEDKLNKKFVVAENFAKLVSTVCFTCLEGEGFDPLWSSNGWGIWPSKLAT